MKEKILVQGENTYFAGFKTASDFALINVVFTGSVQLHSFGMSCQSGHGKTHWEAAALLCSVFSTQPLLPF